MTSRAYAADDGAAIQARLAELRAERDAIFRCTCEPVIGERGEITKAIDFGCPIHGGSAATLIALPVPALGAADVLRITIDAIREREGLCIECRTFVQPPEGWGGEG